MASLTELHLVHFKMLRGPASSTTELQRSGLFCSA
jgi:hypothetical protein